MRIQHNISAMNAKRNLNKNTGSLKKNLEKLSSGYRINRSADDAAGLAISERMRASIVGFEQGKRNVDDGISMIQTAEGALQEIQELMKRMVALATQAANGTLNNDDRAHIQKEVDELLTEIDRIKDTTAFNGIKLFNGSEKYVLDSSGNRVVITDIPFPEYTLVGTDIDSDVNPFYDKNANHMNLRVYIDNPNLDWNDKGFSLLNQNGMTSHSFIVVDGEEISFDDLTWISTTGSITDSADPLCREFTTKSDSCNVDIRVRQKIYITETASEKYFNFSYEFENCDLWHHSLKFLFHADTALNNDNYHEEYYETNADGNPGSRFEETGMYGNSHRFVSQNGVAGFAPDGITIYSTVAENSFHQSVVFGGYSPDVSIADPDENSSWDDYNRWGINETDTSVDDMGGSIDLSFGLAWNLHTLHDGMKTSVDFKYGIVAGTRQINPDAEPTHRYLTEHSNENHIWIQYSGEDSDEGMFLSFDELSTGILGIAGLRVTSSSSARNSLDRLKIAIDTISEVRGKLGAYQNRLEHTYNNIGNTIENLAHAESQIRDVDIATEMMAYTKNNILIQSAQAMLAQSNQVPQGVLQLMR